MHKAAAVVIATVTTACAAPKSPSCSSATGSTVTVVGVATQRLKPSGVSFSVGVETRAASVLEAFTINARKVEQVLAALKTGGVQPDEVQTTELEVSAITSDKNSAITGFRASNHVTVRRGDARGAAELIQAAVGAGANQVSSFQYLVADRAATQRKALELAMADARTRAETLASSSSRTLGVVVCVSETQPPESPMARLASLAYVAPGGGGLPLEPGSHDVQSAVSVVYELR